MHPGAVAQTAAAQAAHVAAAGAVGRPSSWLPAQQPASAPAPAACSFLDLQKASTGLSAHLAGGDVAAARALNNPNGLALISSACGTSAATLSTPLATMRSAWQAAGRALGRRGLATGPSGLQTCSLDEVRSVIKLEAKTSGADSLTAFLQVRQTCLAAFPLWEAPSSPDHGEAAAHKPAAAPRQAPGPRRPPPPPPPLGRS